jgi:hypothetical protein
MLHEVPQAGVHASPQTVFVLPGNVSSHFLETKEGGKYCSL